MNVPTTLWYVVLLGTNVQTLKELMGVIVCLLLITLITVITDENLI